MIALAAHARAAHILAEALRTSAQAAKRDADRALAEGNATQAAALITAGLTLWGMSEAHVAAADAMAAVIREEIAAHPMGCTLDHARLTSPRCPACGGPRAA